MKQPTDPIPDAVSPELAAYYADRSLMWRNVIVIGISNLGWSFAFTIIGPLMLTRMLELKIGANIQGTVGAINMFALSFLVMYFSWKSDHTVTRFGRRKPYFFIAAPFIIGTMALFPFFDVPEWIWLLVTLWLIQIFFMDLKSSIFPLLSIDCSPREMIARTGSIFSIIGGVTGFLTMQFSGPIIGVSHWFPYILGAGVMTLTTLASLAVKEPPIYHPATERFKPWSTFKVTARDKRMFWLIAGVAMIGTFINLQGYWLWFWATDTLNLEVGETLKALSWAPLLNVLFAFPLGWIIDRWGGFKIVMIFWVGQVACFILAMNVHDKGGLILLSLSTTLIGPLYSGADIMIYKVAHPKDLGSLTSTTSCLRNLYKATIMIISTWMIYFSGNNYQVAFVIGIIMSTIGLAMFFIHRRLMSTPAIQVVEPHLELPLPVLAEV